MLGTATMLKEENGCLYPNSNGSEYRKQSILMEMEKRKFEFEYIYGLCFEYLYKMLDYGYFDIVCHLDLIKKFESEMIKSEIKVYQCLICI